MVSLQLNKLSPHSYLTKSNSRYLKQKKEEMGVDVYLFLGDFAENYKFMIQTMVHFSLQEVLVHFRYSDTLLQG